MKLSNKQLFLLRYCRRSWLSATHVAIGSQRLRFFVGDIFPVNCDYWSAMHFNHWKRSQILTVRLQEQTAKQRRAEEARQ